MRVLFLLIIATLGLTASEPGRVTFIRTPDGGSLTAGEVTLAARIEDAYRSVTAAR